MFVPGMTSCCEIKIRIRFIGEIPYFTFRLNTCAILLEQINTCLEIYPIQSRINGAGSFDGERDVEVTDSISSTAFCVSLIYRTKLKSSDGFFSVK